MTDELEEFLPKRKGDIDDSVFLDPTARVMGDVLISDNSSLWPGSVLDGEKSEIKVGENSIIMNKAIIESTAEHKVELGKNSFISPGAEIKGSKIGKDVMIGIDAVVMEDVEIGEGSIVGTDTIIPNGMKIPKNSIVRGRPAEIVGDVDEETLEELDEIRDRMFKKRDEYKLMMKRGEEYNVFDTPKRPKQILESKKEELVSDEDKEEMDKKMKKILSKIDSEDYY